MCVVVVAMVLGWVWRCVEVGGGWCGGGICLSTDGAELEQHSHSTVTAQSQHSHSTLTAPNSSSRPTISVWPLRAAHTSGV